MFSGFATPSHYHTGLWNLGTPVPSTEIFFCLVMLQDQCGLHLLVSRAEYYLNPLRLHCTSRVSVDFLWLFSGLNIFSVTSLQDVNTLIRGHKDSDLSERERAGLRVLTYTVSFQCYKSVSLKSFYYLYLINPAYKCPGMVGVWDYKLWPTLPYSTFWYTK